ncbi:MAG: molybdenum cofactor biosynthesis protein MoaE [Halioglobus sp.]
MKSLSSRQSPVGDSASLHVSVQESDFDTAQLQRALLSGDSAEGAVATFTGYVRKRNLDLAVETLTLEHYPGMTESSILDTLSKACERWPVLAGSVVHRVGRLSCGDQIVWVGISAAHRGDAFAACEFVMDYLKTRAPFWKKEEGPNGSRWLDAREEDTLKASAWE